LASHRRLFSQLQIASSKQLVPRILPSLFAFIQKIEKSLKFEQRVDVINHQRAHNVEHITHPHEIDGNEKEGGRSSLSSMVSKNGELTYGTLVHPTDTT